MKCCLVAGVFVLSVVSSAAAGEFVKIVNAGFGEQADGVAAGWPKTTGWRAEPNAGFNGAGGLVYESEKGLKSRPTQEISLKPGKKYKVTAKVIADDLKVDRPDSGGQGMCVLVSWFDKDGKWLGERQAGPAANGRMTEWRTIETITPDMPANATRFTIAPYVNGNGIGKARIDDIAVETCDMTPVEVVTCSAYRRESTGGLVRFGATVNLSDAYPAEAQRAAFSYVGTDGKRRQVPARFVRGGAVAELDASRFAFGTNDVVCTLYAKDAASGKIKALGSASLPFARLRKLPKRRVVLDARQRLIVDGKPFFPLGMYNSHIYATNLEVYARSPFNVIGPYETWSREKLDMLEAKGIKAIYSVAPGHDAGSERDLARLRKLVTEVRDHPAVIAWYMTDEPCLPLVPALEKRGAIVEAVDGDHPTWGVQCSFGDMRHFNGAYDILGVDPYPVGRPGGGGDVGRMIEAAREGVLSGFGCLAQWHVPQAFAWGWLKRREWEGYRAPTTREMANMTWQAIAGGANGIVYYSFGYYAQPHEDPDDDQKSAFARVCAAASAVRQYERVLLFGDEPPAVETSDPRIAARVYRQGGETYLLVVNASDAARKGTVTVKDRFARVGVTDFGAAPVLTDAGTFAVDLAPMGYFMSRLER